MIKDVFKSFSHTIGRILAYAFVIVFLSFCFSSCEVKAFTLAVPSTYLTYESCNTQGLNCVTYSFDYQKSSLVGDSYYNSLWISQANSAHVIFNFGEINYCLGKNIYVSGELLYRYDVTTNPDEMVSSFHMLSNGSDYTCSVNNVQRSKATYSCSGQGGGYFQFLIDLNGYITENDVLLNREVTLTCDATNNTIISNDNKNTQDIIDNNNSNTDKVISSQDKTTAAVKENNETNKSILQKIIELPGNIINLLIEALKSLFIPEDDYFTNKFNEIRDLTNSKLGILGYPFTLVIDTLEFFLTIEDSGSYVIKWEDIYVPNFENSIIIPAGYYDLSSVLENKYIKIAHDLYLVFINALLILSFIKLCKNKYSSIFGGDYDNSFYLGVDN